MTAIDPHWHVLKQKLTRRLNEYRKGKETNNLMVQMVALSAMLDEYVPGEHAEDVRAFIESAFDQQLEVLQQQNIP